MYFSMSNMIIHFVHVLYLVFQVFPIEHLQIFTEKELERLLCGEHDSWAVCIISLKSFIMYLGY